MGKILIIKQKPAAATTGISTTQRAAADRSLYAWPDAATIRRKAKKPSKFRAKRTPTNGVRPFLMRSTGN